MDAPLDIYSYIGFVGTACIIGAYFYLTAELAWRTEQRRHGTNLAGAALLTVSLLVHTNVPSLVLEGFWAAIALWGLGKALRKRGQATGEKESDA